MPLISFTLNAQNIILLVFLCFFGFAFFIIYALKTQLNQAKKNLHALNLEHENLKSEHILKDQELLKLSSEIFHVKEDLDIANNELEEKNSLIEDLNEQKIHRLTYIAELEKSMEEKELYEKKRENDLKQNEEKLRLEFQCLAQNLLEKSAKDLTQKNEEKLLEILSPVKTQLHEFKQKVEEVYINETKQKSELSNELKHLKELNYHLSDQANALANALENKHKTQGCWGEMLLESVLENSGLRKDEQYQRELVLKGIDGELYRPDVLINLPQNRHVIVDAKTSLSAYVRYQNSKDETQKAKALNEHVKAINEHIKSLSEKSYEKLQGINSLDFVFMFMPIEEALILALQNDADLYDRAFKSKIILVSPTTLLLALKSIEHAWKYEKQAKSISLIYARAEKMYDKFVLFVQDLQNAKRYINEADKAYEKAINKLALGKGSILRQVEDLKILSNLKVKKNIPQDLIDKNEDHDLFSTD